MVLTATAEGLGTCWIGSFSEEKVKSLLNIPDRFRVVALIAMGYQREKLELGSKILHLVRRKKSLEKITALDGFGKTLKPNIAD
jgi:nitroreductase